MRKEKENLDLSRIINVILNLLLHRRGDNIMRDTLLDMPYDNPFKNDKFEREAIARNFMKIFDKDQYGIVLAIDSEWGTGKTTFIKMWETLINNSDEYKDKYETLYFNSWSNDYIQDPLLAILTEIDINGNKKNKESLEKLKQFGKKWLSLLYQRQWKF